MRRTKSSIAGRASCRCRPAAKPPRASGHRWSCDEAVPRMHRRRRGTRPAVPPHGSRVRSAACLERGSKPRGCRGAREPRRAVTAEAAGHAAGGSARGHAPADQSRAIRVRPSVHGVLRRRRGDGDGAVCRGPVAPHLAYTHETPEGSSHDSSPRCCSHLPVARCAGSRAGRAAAPVLCRGRRLAGAWHSAAAQRQADRDEPGLRERPLWRAAAQASAPAAGEARMLRRDDDDHAVRRRAVLLYRWQSASAGHQFHPESQGRAHHDLDRWRQHPALHQHRRRHRRGVPAGRCGRDPERPAADCRGAPPRRGTGRADCRRELLRPVPRGVGAAARSRRVRCWRRTRW